MTNLNHRSWGGCSIYIYIGFITWYILVNAMNFWDTCFAIKIVIWISSQIHIGFPLWLWAQDFPSYQFHKLRFALDCWRLYKYVKTLDGPETLCFFAPKSTKRGLSVQKWFRNSNDWNPTIGHFNTHVVGGVFCFLTPFPSFSTPFSTYSFEIFWDIDWPVSWRFWLMNWKMNHPKQDSCCLNQLKKTFLFVAFCSAVNSLFSRGCEVLSFFFCLVKPPAVMAIYQL